MSYAVCLLVAAIAGGGPSVWPVVQQQQQQRQQSRDGRRQKDYPGLKALSKELTRLRASVEYRGWVYAGSSSMAAVHLGDGLVAAAHIGGVEPGMTGTFNSRSGTYRIIAVSADKRLGLVTLFKMRDWPLKPVPARPEPRHEDWRERLGELVCVVRSGGIELCSSSRSIGFRRGKGGKRVSFAHVLPVSSAVAGSVALTADGRFLGLVIDREGGRRVRLGSPRRGSSRQDPAPKRREQKGGEQKSSEPARRTWFAVDAAWLLARAKRDAAALVKVERVSLGVSLGMLWRRGEGGKSRAGPGLRVSRVCVGAPAALAGVLRGDVWVELNGSPLTSRDQVRAALEKVPDGGVLNVRFRRDGGELVSVAVRAN